MLSVTAKAKARAQKKEADKMEVESAGGRQAEGVAKEEPPPAPPPQQDEEKDDPNLKEPEKEQEKEPEKEPEFSVLDNPARVLMQQVCGCWLQGHPLCWAAVPVSLCSGRWSVWRKAPATPQSNRQVQLSTPANTAHSLQ